MYILLLKLLSIVPILLLHINIWFYFLTFAFFHSCIPIEIHESTSRIRCDDVSDIDVLYHTKKNKKTNTDGKYYYYISSEVNVIKLLWEEIGDNIRPANIGARVVAFVCDRCYSYSYFYLYKESLNGRRHTNKYGSVLTGVLSYSIHIQFFSQNQSLLFPI